MKTEIGYVKKGDFVEHQGEVWQVVKTDFNFQGRGMATVKMKIKSTVSGKNVEITQKSNAPIDTADVQTIQMQYLYKDNENLFFMDEQTYQQWEIPLDLVEFDKYLKENEKYYVMMYREKPLSVRPPTNVKLRVTQTEAAVKGDTVSGAKKPAVMETGATVMVPLFIKVGDILSINPETESYVERVKE